jgi:DNA-binding transcriptional LysR family regulator
MTNPLAGWDEIRTAYEVARAGTVSGAAEVLGVHHATVIRHVDALETRLGAKLFQRHARGYTPTEAGRDLLEVARGADDQFSQLVGRVRGQGEGVAGDLVVTSLPTLSPRLAPVLVAFQEMHPGLIVRYLAGRRLFRLEYGEAHVAIRAGITAPDQPDNVVRAFGRVFMGLYASGDYLARVGRPRGGDLAGQAFVGVDDPEGRAPFMSWLAALGVAGQVRFTVSDEGSVADAVVAGAGLGFLDATEAARLPGVEEVVPPRPDWEVPLWLVTHVDLHRTPKVQAFLAFLREQARGWPGQG